MSDVSESLIFLSELLIRSFLGKKTSDSLGKPMSEFPALHFLNNVSNSEKHFLANFCNKLNQNITLILEALNQILGHEIRNFIGKQITFYICVPKKQGIGKLAKKIGGKINLITKKEHCLNFVRFTANMPQDSQRMEERIVWMLLLLMLVMMLMLMKETVVKLIIKERAQQPLGI